MQNETTDNDVRLKACTYCEATNHKSTECSKVAQVANWKKILMTKALCFNCTGSKHKASACRSQKSCLKCGQRHHTSLCDYSTKLPGAGKKGGEPMLVTTGVSKVVYPVVVVRVNGVSVGHCWTQVLAALMPRQYCCKRLTVDQLGERTRELK